jgi:hypothetical protein
MAKKRKRTELCIDGSPFLDGIPHALLGTNDTPGFLSVDQKNVGAAGKLISALMFEILKAPCRLQREWPWRIVGG